MVELDLSPLQALHDADQSDKATETPIYNKLDRESEYVRRQKEVNAYYQENIKRAKMKRSEILKQIREKKSPMGILLTAIECISMMTGDDTFLKQAQDDLIKSYSDE